MKTNAAEREIDALCDSELDSVSGGEPNHTLEIWLPNIGMTISCTPDGSKSWVRWPNVLH